MRKTRYQLARILQAVGVGKALACACLSLLLLASTAQGRLPSARARSNPVESLRSSSSGEMQDAQPHAQTDADSQASDEMQADPDSDADNDTNSADASTVKDKNDDGTDAQKATAAVSFYRERVLRFFGRLHPVVVHFPIALLSVGAMFEILWVLFGNNHTRPSTSALACVVFGALGAAVAAWYGWLNADFESHGRGVAFTLRIHRWLGISTASLAAIAMVAGVLAMLKTHVRSLGAKKMGASAAVYRVSLMLAAVGVAITGHFGGELVYGSGYFSEVLFPDPPVSRVTPMPEELRVSTAAPIDIDPELTAWIAMLDDGKERVGSSVDEGRVDLSVDFVRQIAPIFANHCVKCHGPKKHKGDLRLDARHFVFDDRYADEQVIVPGDAQASELHWRISLPPNDEDVMPPEDKGDPLLPAQRALIEQWITEGAVWIDVPIIAPDE